MTKVIPFPARRVRRFAASVLALTASREQLSKPAWTNRPLPPEPLGNMLQRLALYRPELVSLFESVVAEMLAAIDRETHP